MAWHREVGDQRALADSLEALAAATGLQGHSARAARLWAAAARLRREAGAPLEAWYRERREHWLATVRSQAPAAA